MARRYEIDELMWLRSSPLVAKPPGLPPIEEWMYVRLLLSFLLTGPQAQADRLYLCDIGLNPTLQPNASNQQPVTPITPQSQLQIDAQASLKPATSRGVLIQVCDMNAPRPPFIPSFSSTRRILHLTLAKSTRNEYRRDRAWPTKNQLCLVPHWGQRLL